MSKIVGQNPSGSRFVSLAIVGIVLAVVGPAAAADDGDAKAPAVKALPAECALLDDPAKRALMDGLLFKLLVACDRTDELGQVRQSPSEAVGPTPEDGTDVAVNDPGGDSGASTTQSETSMAVNEVTGTVCAGYNDSYHHYAHGGGFTGFSRSTDNGSTFVDRGALGDDSRGDPAIVWRRADGHFYFGALHTDGLGLWKSTDDCQTFQWLGMMHSGFSDDKELLTVDNNPDSLRYGNLYMVFTNFSSDARIWALSSADAGVTWTNSQAISATDNVQGAWPAVAPNGDVYVGWVKFNGSEVTMEIARSTDGGASYSMVTSPAAGVLRPENPAASGSCGRAALKGNIRYLPSPQVVVGADGVLHTVYSYSPGSGDDCDSFYRRSDDNGATWGPEVRLHDDSTSSDQFFPSLSVGASNIVSVSWYDRRLDADNLFVDTYHAFSFDGGLTWGANQRISDVSTPIYLDPDLATCYHGDYDTHVQTETHAVTQWSDDRNLMNGHNDPDVFTDPIPVSTDFLVTVDPVALEVCKPNDGVATIDVLQFLGFSEPVALSADNVPAGAMVGFMPNPVTPPGTSALTIGGTAGVAPGSYAIDIVGTSTPSSFSHDASVILHLFGAAPGAVDLVAPANGSLDQPQRPDFSWTAATEAGGYRLQVATDAAFTAVVIDAAGLQDVTFTPSASLPSSTPHFWRVRADNTCGPGAWSPTSTFTTVALPGDCSFGSTALQHYFDDFESGAPGWKHLAAVGPDTWGLTGGISGTQSGVLVFHVDDIGDPSDQRLVSPPISLPLDGSGRTLQYWNYQQMEDSVSGCYDGSILEITTDGGTTWTQLEDPVLLTDPYAGVVDDGYDNPLAGLNAWCGDPQPWRRAVVDLDDHAGETVQFRFRIGTDDLVDHPGWDIDDVRVQSCVAVNQILFADGFESGNTEAWLFAVP